MKKYLFLAAAAAMFAACSNEDVLVDEGGSTSKETPITFSTFTEKATRAENSDAGTTYALKNYHTTFKVWGYKNVEATTGTLTSTPVFDGVVLTWADTPSDPFTNTGDWTYSPIRFWDKAAASYDFHAAAPSTASWSINKTANSGMTVGGLTFSINGATVSGESLPFDFSAATATPLHVTGQPDDKFSTDIDLMIATDVTKTAPYTQENRVEFLFNHILSRLNIGVKTSLATPNVVVLKSLEVYNMNSKGNFNESADAADQSAKITRWGSQSTPLKVGFPNSQVSTSAMTISSDVTLNSKTATPADYKLVYQGLVIPQTVAYQSDLKLNGSNASSSSKPYLKIVYTVNGEEFTSFYNLASLFVNANAPYVNPTYGAAYKLAAGGYAYLATDGKYYSAGGELLPSEPTWLDGDTETTGVQKVAATYQDLLNEGRDVCDVNFCEGWQNNLWITIGPDAILFTANVYEWATHEEKAVHLQ